MPPIFLPAQEPKTKLGRYRLLSPTAGVHVSPIALGAMSIGHKSEALGMGAMNKESSFELLDGYYDNGGNFINTANSYQDENSEEFIGEWAEKLGIRDQLIATMYTQNFKRPHNQHPTQKVIYAGNNAKTLKISVEASLKKLRTHYLDLLYVHWWDWDTSIEEVMRSLHALVMAGTVIYLGISGTPAWIVSKANEYARCHGITPFSVYQDRAFERDIIPMAYAEGMALAPWNVLAQGKIRTDEQEEAHRQSGEMGRMIMSPNWERNETEKKVCKALEKAAGEIGTKSIQAVAIAYLMQKTTYVFPIVGGRKIEHLLANVEALSISLTNEQVKYIEEQVPFDPGFPQWMVGDSTKLNAYWVFTAHVDNKPIAKPLHPDTQ